MIDYILFSEQSQRRFCDFLRKRNIQFIESTDHSNAEGKIISIDDGLDDALDSSIEEYYEAMLELDETITMQHSENSQHQAGISIYLNNGESIIASVNPTILNKVLSVISKQELSDFVDSIVSAIESPDSRPLCKR